MRTVLVRPMTAVLALALAPLGACRPSDPAAARATEGRIAVCVSIQPLAYFVERVGGSHVRIETLVGAGQSPHTFEPTPQQMAWLARANVAFSVGMPFEARLLDQARKQRPELRVVDAAQGLTFLFGACTHDHDHGAHEHGAEERDPHVWLDPLRAKTMAANIARALGECAPQRRAEFERNLRALHADLDALDERLRTSLAAYSGRAFLVFHPAYAYFAERYGLEMLAVEVDGKEPTPRQLVELVERVRAAGVRAVLIEPQYSAASAAALAREIGAEVLPIDDLARDYLNNMEDIAAKVIRSMGVATPADGG